MTNTSFTTGIFPSALKVASIIPIYKKGDKLECSNYQLISLLSNIHLTSFLNKNKLLSSFQFGFRNKHSANHALPSLTEMIHSAIDNDHFTCGIFYRPTESV